MRASANKKMTAAPKAQGPCAARRDAGRRDGGAAGAAAPYTDSSGKMNLPDPVCGSSGSAAEHAGAE